MAQFPDIPLALTASAAFGADLTTAPSTWAFTDLTCTHPSNPAQTISRVAQDTITLRTKALIGASGDTGGTSSGTLKLLNHDGYWTPGNPASPHYPYIDEGLPIRLTVADYDAPVLTDTFTRTITNGWGTSTNGVTWTPATPTAAAVTGTAGTLSVATAGQNRTVTATGLIVRDVDMTFDATWPVVATGSASAGLITGPQLRRTSTTTWIRAAIQQYLSGAVYVYLVSNDNGTLTTHALTGVPGLTHTAGQTLRCRVRLEGDRAQMRIWAAAGTEPGVWHADVTGLPLTAPGAITMQAGTGSGTTNTHPLIGSVDNITVTSLPSVRAGLYVTDIQPTFEPSAGGFTWSTVQVSLGGVGTILEKRRALSQSPMRRSVQQAAIPPYAYWPLEDTQGSTSAASAFPDGPRGLLTGPGVFAFDAGTPSDEYLVRYGTKPLLSLAAGAKLTMAVPAVAVQTEWAVSFVSQCSAPLIPVTELRIAQWETPGSSFERWALIGTATGYIVRGYTRTSGSPLQFDFVTYTSGVIATQVTWTIEAKPSGPNTNFELFANDYPFGAAGYSGVGLSAVTRITLNPDAVNTTASVSPYGIKLVYGHTRIKSETFTPDTPFYTPPETGLFVTALTAWTREPAHRRALRLCAEEQVQLVLDYTPDITGSTMLGAQRDGTFQDLLKAAVEAESGGLLYEDTFGYRLLPRDGRYNRAPALVVDLATYCRSGDTAQDEVLVPQLSSRAPNYWTISRTGGSEGTWAADAEYRKRRGTVADERTLDLLSDGVLGDHARWRTHVNTDDRGGNYPVLPVDLTANPSLIEAFKGLRIGDRVRRTNQPTIAGPDLIDQVIEGVTEKLAPNAWSAELDVAPASVWEVAVYDDPLTRRDSSSTTLGVARDATQTAWTFSTAFKSDVWDTTAVPYNVTCAGETATVTAMGAATGTGPYLQAATVTRSVNGIVKPQPVGSPIHLTLPAYRAL